VYGARAHAFHQQDNATSRVAEYYAVLPRHTRHRPGT
jgi:hypothetical protein